MWDQIRKKFVHNPSQQKVVSKMISIGLNVEPDLDSKLRIYCDGIEIKPNSLAAAINVDRRVVVETLRKISTDPVLMEFFRNIRPVCNLGVASSKVGMGVIEILPDSAKRPGIIWGVSEILAREHISIRQVIGDDPDLVENPKATIVTDAPVPASLLSRIKAVPGVQAVVIL
ncbi:MAG: regulator [Thermoplasmataceae archaeon]